MIRKSLKIVSKTNKRRVEIEQEPLLEKSESGTDMHQLDEYHDAMTEVVTIYIEQVIANFPLKVYNAYQI